MKREFNLGTLKYTFVVENGQVGRFNIDMINGVDNNDLELIGKQMEDGKYEGFFPINEINMKKVEVVDSEEHLK